jgi:hypothetical protein
MTQVTAQMSVSLDGFYAGPRDPRDPRTWPARNGGLSPHGISPPSNMRLPIT